MLHHLGADGALELAPNTGEGKLGGGEGHRRKTRVVSGASDSTPRGTRKACRRTRAKPAITGAVGLVAGAGVFVFLSLFFNSNFKIISEFFYILRSVIRGIATKVDKTRGPGARARLFLRLSSFERDFRKPKQEFKQG